MAIDIPDIKRVLIGEPFPTSHEIHERLDKVRALAVFASDPISSNAYATEAIIEVDRCDFERNYAQEGSALMLERTTKAQIWSSQWRGSPF